MMDFIRIILNPTKLLANIFGVVCIFFIRFKRNVQISKNCRFIGIPIVDVCKNGRLEINRDVIINSCNHGYHANLHTRAKLFCDFSGIIKIGEKTRIHGSCVHATKSIEIGKRCLIAGNCQLIDSSGHDLSFDNVELRRFTKGKSKPIVIEDDVWLGLNTIVLPGVKIGRGSVISANSVVLHDIPPFSLAGGNPATVIKSYYNMAHENLK